MKFSPIGGGSSNDDCNGSRSSIHHATPRVPHATTTETVVVAAAAAKNIIIPNAMTPVQMDWYVSTTPKPSVRNAMSSVPYHNVASKRRSTTGSTILIHQSNQEETWPGGAIWDISWCMAQLIIGILHGGPAAPGTTTTTSTSRGKSRNTMIGSSSTTTTIPPTILTTTTTFYHDASLTNSLLLLPNPPEQTQCCISNAINTPQRVLEWIHTDHPEPSAVSLAALMGHSQNKESTVRQPKYHSERGRTTRNRTTHPNNSRGRTIPTSILVLELGCGTGWTGIALAAVTAASSSSSSTQCTVILTDLDVVIEKVTLPNVQRNIPSVKQNVIKTSFPLYVMDPRPHTYNDDHAAIDDKHVLNIVPKPQLPLHIYTMNSRNQNGRLIATPLCWGNRDDMNAVQSMIRYLQSPPPPPHHHTNHQNATTYDSTRTQYSDDNDDRGSAGRNDDTDGIPDILIVGDVAYQHKPGAASHFDILLETILHFTKADHTLLILGLRIRMNASMDLYQMLLHDFVDIMEPIVPHEIDPIRFPNHANKKHMNTMTIHFMKRKERINETTTKE